MQPIISVEEGLGFLLLLLMDVEDFLGFGLLFSPPSLLLSSSFVLLFLSVVGEMLSVVVVIESSSTDDVVMLARISPAFARAGVSPKADVASFVIFPRERAPSMPPGVIPGVGRSLVRSDDIGVLCISFMLEELEVEESDVLELEGVATFAKFTIFLVFWGRGELMAAERNWRMLVV